jgi:hypothetical protein
MVVVVVMVRREMRGLGGGELGRDLGRGFDGGGFWRVMMGDGEVSRGMMCSCWLVYSVTAVWEGGLHGDEDDECWL